LKVFVDGAEITLQDGSTLKNALDAAGVSPQNEAIIGIVKGREEEARETNSYWLNTTKGKLRIELLDTGLQDVWHQAVGQISGLRGAVERRRRRGLRPREDGDGPHQG